MPPQPPWPALQVKHLAALQAVAGAGSFHGAARELGYSQSAVSQQIAALEAIVGEQLLTRPTARGERVGATPAGEVLLAESAAIIGRLRAAGQRVEAIRGGRTGVVRVGVPIGIAGLFLGPALDAFAEAAPAVELELVEAAADAALFRLLDEGGVDTAFVVLPAERGPYAVEPLFADEFLLVAAHGSELGDRDALDLEDLHRLRLLCLRRCRATTTLLGRLADQGIEPDVVFRSDDTSALVGLLDHAEAALLPALAAPESPQLVVRTFASHPYRRLGLAWHESRPPVGAVKAFEDVCRALLAGERRLAPLRDGEPAELRVSLQHAR
jgi:DNA-binding transcriptional LysR family regulator